MSRVPFVEAHAAARQSIQRAVAAKLNATDYRVLLAVHSFTVTWSRLTDRRSLSQIAAEAGFKTADDPVKQHSNVERCVSRSLGRLVDAGAITYRAARGRGRISEIGLPAADAKGDRPAHLSGSSKGDTSGHLSDGRSATSSGRKGDTRTREKVTPEATHTRSYASHGYARISERSGGDVPPGTSLEEREHLLAAAIRCLAERRADEKKPDNRDSYVAGTVRGLQVQLTGPIAAIDWTQAWTVEALAEALKPPAPKAVAPLLPCHLSIDRPRCDVCEGTGWIELEDSKDVDGCPRCNAGHHTGHAPRRQ